MTATCITSNLARAVREVMPTVPRNSRIKYPILGNALIRARESGVEVITTDLESFTVKRAGGKLSNGEEFEIAVPAHALADWLAVFEDDNEAVELTHDKRTASLTLSVPAFRMMAELKGIDAGEFPAVPAYLEGEGVTVAIPADVLAWLCKFAAKDGRTANGGCQPLDTLQIEVEDGKASFVASDGVTLALAEYPAQGEVSANFPARAVKNALKGQSKGDVILNVTAQALALNGAMIRAEEHEYPDWRPAANAPFTTTATVDYWKLAGVLKPFAKRGGCASFCVNGNLPLTAVDDNGESTGAIEAQHDGLGLSVSLSPKVVEQALAVDKPKRKEARTIRLELSPAMATIHVTESIRVIVSAYIEPQPEEAESPEAEAEPEPTPAVEVEEYTAPDLTPPPGHCTFCGREWAGGGMCPACRAIDEEDAITRRDEADPDAQERPDDTYPDEPPKDVESSPPVEDADPLVDVVEIPAEQVKPKRKRAKPKPIDNKPLAERIMEKIGPALVECPRCGRHNPPATICERCGWGYGHEGKHYAVKPLSPIERAVRMIGLHQGAEAARQLAGCLVRAFPDLALA